jgi:DcuC family C4-dicarboxylate transporter
MAASGLMWAAIDWRLPLGAIVILAAILAIARQLDVRLVLLTAALLLGAMAEKADAIVRKFFSTFCDERFVIPICTAMGFSYVLRQTGCDQHLVRLLVRPLVKVRGFLAPGTVLVGFLVNMPVVSQTSTALAIGPVIIPILRAAQIPAIVIGAALLMGSSIGGELFNPGAPELRTTVVESNIAAVKMGEADGTYTTARCIERLRPLNLLGLVVATLVFWWRIRASRAEFSPSPPGTPGGEGRGEGGQHPARTLQISAGPPALTPDPSPPEYRGRGETEIDLRVNYLKAFVPLAPIVLLAIFAPGIGFKELPHEWLDYDAPGQFETRLIGAAMLVGVALALATTPSGIPKAAESFFQGAGYGFANIISIIVAANCFGEGIKLIGIAQLLTDQLATDPQLLIAMAGVLSLGFAVLCGSGMATAQSLFPFFASSALQLGVDPTHVGAVVSLAAAAGRTMSPMAAVNQMCARLTDTKATDLSRLVAPPLLAGVAAIIIAAMIWVPN